jgi:TRAP transporter 4TM/12TM fusion protein
MLLLVLEATRRAVGLPLVVLTLFFGFYTLYGRYFPRVIGHAGYSLEEIIAANFMATDGLYGLIIGVLSDFIIIFLIFSCVMEESGGINFFIDIANSLAGHRVGGPAKVSVITSTLFGMVSGSSAANVVVDGIFTIPMMKRMGFSPEMAGAVEAATSTGGQIMPPVMGASAFVMAAILGITYLDVCKAASVPALLYFFSIWMTIHFFCKKKGLMGLPMSESLPRFRDILKDWWYMPVPIVGLVYFMVLGYTPTIAGLAGIILTVIVTSFRRKTRLTPMKFFSSLENSGKGAVSMGLTCACAGVLVSFIVMSGLGMRLTDLIKLISGGNLWIALFSTMIASLILGMGMPTVGVYIIVATLGAPALVSMGVSPIAAHLFIFYFGIICNVTPPVALAAYAAAPIAKSDPWKTGWIAFFFAIAGFIVPYFFVTNNALLLKGDWMFVGWSVLTALLGVICLAATVSGYFITETSVMERIIFFIAALVLIHPGIFTDIIGIALLVGLYLWQRRKISILFQNRK